MVFPGFAIFLGFLNSHNPLVLGCLTGAPATGSTALTGVEKNQVAGCWSLCGYAHVVTGVGSHSCFDLAVFGAISVGNG